jgi:transaldolase
VKTLGDLRVKVFGDVADVASILELQDKPFVKGFTTNPTLMSKAGVLDYEAFASQVLHHITDRPVSFEVLADDNDTIEWQASPDRELGSERVRQNPGYQHASRTDV